MAQSIVASVEVVILSIVMLVKDKKLFDRDFIDGIWQILSITGFSIVAAYIMVSLLPLSSNDTGFVALGFKLGMITLVTGTVHIGLSNLFGLKEAIPVVRKLKLLAKSVLKPVRIEW